MDKNKWINQKILSLEQVQQQCRIQKLKNKKIVFTNGCFDILHHGHIDILTQAAQLGDFLIVGLNTDSSVSALKGPERPLNHEKDRAYLLAALLMVDAVCLFNEATPLQLIQSLKPDVLVKGGDYSLDQIVGAQEVNTWGGTTHIIPFSEGYSTTGLVTKIKSL